MNCSTTIHVTVAGLILACAGMALSVQPATDPPRATPHESRQQDPNRMTNADFRSADWVNSRSVVNDNGEVIADVSNLVIDRGSGRIEHIVVKTGGVLGLGGREIAIPVNSFRWDSGKDQNLLLSATAEQLEKFPEFTPQTWSKVSGTLAKESDSRDPYAGSLDNPSTARVQGTITSVRRERLSGVGEQVLVVVATDEGANREIALGPTWFVNSSEIAPMRGDSVVIDTMALPRDPDHRSVATRLSANGKDLRLRDNNAKPLWHVDSSAASTSPTRLLLASDLQGKSVTCRGKQCGTVHDVIFERTSGDLAFLSIDPNENFLGIADTKRLVPWAVASVGSDGGIRLDASKEMILSSMETPTDLVSLNSSAGSVYKAYDVAPPRFEPLPPAPPTAAALGEDAWSTQGPVLRAIDRGSATKISGTVSNVHSVDLGEGVRPAKALTLKTTTGEQVVLLGPAWYMDNQPIKCDKGAVISSDVYQTTINGKPYWIARTIDVNGDHIVLIDSSNTPSWDRE
ncbi:MAG: PRC-barrel domain-containing protein [Phycisphaeraceae bacterium]|nr:PRC-barrel domain-containing protein [Phycisphaeraceae bacterium]